MILFFENRKFTIVAYGEIKNLNYLKTSDHMAKRSEIWDLWEVVQHIRDTFSGQGHFEVIRCTCDF